MKNYQKYTRNYFMPPESCIDWTRRDYVEKAPVWCSVDLRDGNQSLIVPMSLEEKLDFFNLLVKIGFKEIEIGFPAASETEYEFCRALIEQDLIPDDVTIQVLTQSRPHIIEKTFAALDGAKNAIVHLYNSTSVAQREQVFQKSKEEIIEIAVSGAKLLQEYSERVGDPYRFEYSPESFTGTEMEFALEICNAVLDVWRPAPDKKVIINLPVTVSLSMPHVYASQIEYMHKHLKYRDAVVLSQHPHNDRGCAIADTEMGMLAGAQRVEGTLFGNGERTGNVDIITLALNLYSQGVDPELNFENIPAITELYERVTRMPVYDRQPYSGALVFAAFSGSHQDAIAKGMKWREGHDCPHWTVPYLPIDPKDIGREYEGDVIRINSQSGKGGIGYLLEQRYGYRLPAKMREDFGYTVKSISDHQHKELTPSEVHHIFKDYYVNFFQPLDVTEVHFIQKNGIFVMVTAKIGDEVYEFTGTGNGRLDAVANALKNSLKLDFSLLTYEEHALERGTNSRAVAYVSISCGRDNKICWGSGVHDDIMAASVNALVSAINRAGLIQQRNA
ncbi:2-isopropylmalate synthase [Clostridiaceae bacterium NSJ-31]|uniref:2-isopropylmalate synthase n=2 Tax=Ligaoa zhengdingensis TaxID=2763658 RepID=A0A926DUG6_9FIRM|nr:2-isopropylmalate synthase [Ligaoa zhengdingensis]MBC8545500.1 2-isopropylmalate synthase [Ligaoa zhengdingensis]